MTNQKAIERIKKLLRLAAKSTSQGEVANALSQAQKLMAKYGLENNSIELSDINEVFAKSKHQSMSLPAYQGELIYIIQAAFGCKAIRSQDDDFKIGVVFIGHNERPVIAQYAYEVLERQLNKARKEYLATLNKRLKKTTKVSRADIFCAAWVMAVSHKVTKLAISDEEQNQIAEFMSAKHPDLVDSKVRKVDPSKARGGDTAAMIAGHAAGQSATLNHGMSGTESKKLTMTN